MEYSVPVRNCFHWTSFSPLSLSCFARIRLGLHIRRPSCRWNYVGISGGLRTSILLPLATRTGDHRDLAQEFKLKVNKLDQSLISTLESLRVEDPAQRLGEGVHKTQLTIEEFNLICDNTLSKCDNGLLPLEEILHFLNQTRHSIQHMYSTKTSRDGVWNYLEDSIQTFIDDLTLDNYIEILASGQDANGVWIWSSRFLRTLQRKLETLLQNESSDGGQFVCFLLFYLSTPVPCCCTSSFIRSLHKHITFNLNKWDVVCLVCIMEKISTMDPPPPEALEELFYNKSFLLVCSELKSDEVDSSTSSALLESYLKTLMRLETSPPASMQQGIINKVLEWIKRDIDVKTNGKESGITLISKVGSILTPLMTCHSSAVLQFKETQKNVLNEIIVSMDNVHQVSGLHKVLESYLNFDGRHYSQVVRILADEYFRRGEIGTLRTVNAVIETLRTGNCLTQSDLQTLIKNANSCLDDSTKTERIYLLSSLAKNNTYDPIFDRVLESLMKEGGLTSEQLFRVICSCGKFTKHLNLDRESISSSLTNGLDTKHLQEADLEHLVYFVDALMKHQYQDEAIGRILINNIFRRESELDLKTMVHCLKACLVVGGIKAIDGVIEKFEKSLEAEYHTLKAEDLSYTLELLAMLGYHSSVTNLTSHSFESVFKDEFVKVVYTQISKRENELDGSSFGRIFRYMGALGYPDDALVESLISRCREISNSISNVDVSWILWSIAKKKHNISRSAFDDLSDAFSHSIKEVDVKSLCRFVFACGSLRFYNSQQLDEISNRVCQLECEEVSLVGIGTLTWAFTQLNYRNDEILKWLDSNLTAQNLRKANFRTLGNLIKAFIHFKFKPNIEFLEVVLNSSDNRMEKLSSFEFSCVVHGFVEFEFSVPGNWLKQAVDHFESNLNTFKGHTLCYVIQSLVELGYHPSPEILDITTNSIHKDILKIEYNNLARYLQACGKSGYKPSNLISELESRIKRQGDRIHVKTSSALAFSLAMCQSTNFDAMKALAWGSFDRMHQMTASQLSMFLWGLAKGGFHGKRVFERGAKLTVEKVEEISGIDLLYSVWAFARARQPASEFLKLAIKRLPKTIANYDPYRLSSLAWALTKHEVYNTKILKAIDRALEDQIMNFPVKALVSVLYSFASLRYLPSSMDLVWSRLEEIGLEASNSWSIMKSLLWSAFVLNKQVPRNIQLTLEEMIKTRTPLAWKGGQFMVPENSDFRPQYLPLVLYSLCGLELHDSKAAELCIERINKIDVLETLDIQLSSFLAQCALLSEAKGLKSPISEIPEHYKNKMKKIRKEKNIEEMRSPPTRLHRQLKTILQQSNVKFKEMILLPQKGLLIKILIQGAKNVDEHELLAVDICEKEDVCVNLNTLTGHSLMRQKLLKGAGMKILTIVDNDFPVEDQLLDQLSKVGYPLEKEAFNMESTSLSDSVEVDEDSTMEWVDKHKDEFIDEEGSNETSVKPLNRRLHLQ